MPLIQVPFQRGQDERVDSKVAPMGTLRRLENARMDKLGRVVKRPGAVAHTLLDQGGSTVVSGALPVQRLYSHSSAHALRVYATQTTDAIYGDTVDGRMALQGIVGAWAAPRRIQSPTSFAGSVDSVASAYTNGHVCLLSVANDSVTAQIMDTDGNLRLTARLNPAQANTYRVRLVACGNIFVAVWSENTGAERLRISTYDTATPGDLWSSVVTITSTYLTGSTEFDVCS
jgi:hypothetical protein